MKSCSVVCWFDLIWLYPFLCLSVSLLVWYMSYGMIYALVCSWSCSWSDGSLLYYMAWIYSIVHSIHKDIIPFHMVQNCIHVLPCFIIRIVLYHIIAWSGYLYMYLCCIIQHNILYCTVYVSNDSTDSYRIVWYIQHDDADITLICIIPVPWYYMYICVVYNRIRYVLYIVHCIAFEDSGTGIDHSIDNTIQYLDFYVLLCYVTLVWSGLV